MNDMEKLYMKPFKSKRGGMFYNLFSYPTKIAPETIAIYIATHTRPGDTVLDMFGGSGSTALAALMCERPTSSMLEETKKLDINPVWGARNAVVYEIGKFGSFATKVLANAPDENLFKEDANDLLSRADKEIGHFYNAKNPNGKNGIIRHVIWSDIIICPNCGHEDTYYKIAIKKNPVRFLRKGICPGCGKESNINDYINVVETYQDTLTSNIEKRRKRVPVLIYGSTGKENWMRPFSKDDYRYIEPTIKTYNMKITPKKIKWGDLYRSGYHVGIEYLHQFYTERNFAVFSRLWDMTYDYSEKTRSALQLWLLSYNQSHSTLMSRVVAKSGQKDFVLTGAQSGVLYISHLPVEKNILLGLKSKLNVYLTSFEYLNKCTGQVVVRNTSSTNLLEPDKSIDYIFSDPPFGDFIPYSEVNQINELWLDDTTSTDEEAIISKAQNRDIDDYLNIIEKVFQQTNRVLKNDGTATIVFHSSDKDVWNGFMQAINSSGYSVYKNTLLDKTQNSFIQTVSDGGVKKDNLMLLRKTNKINYESRKSTLSIESFFNLNHFDLKKDSKTLYSEYVESCIANNFQIGYSSEGFYDLLRKSK